MSTGRSAATPNQRQMYLTLHTMPDGSSSSVAVSVHEALTFDREQFAEVYLNSVYGAKRKEALAWADTQIELRAKATGSG